MKGIIRPIEELFADLQGARVVDVGAAAPGEPKPVDVLKAHARRAAMGLVVMGAVAGAAYQVGGMVPPTQNAHTLQGQIDDQRPAPRTPEEALARMIEEGSELDQIPEEIDGFPLSVGEAEVAEKRGDDIDVSDIGSLIARLNPHAKTLAMIDEASAKVGAPARLMRAMAGLESSLDAKAKSSSSTATGLYQFIEETWLSKVQSHGHKYGLGHLAKQIRRGSLDECIVDSPKVRAQILALRKNPRLNAYLAAELTVDNARRLGKLLGRPVTETEIYMTHFFGVTDAARFLKAADLTPDIIGAKMFPKEARANRPIFEMAGRPATLGEIRKRFSAKMSKLDLPNQLAAIDTVASAAVEVDQGAELARLADWRERKGETKVAAPVRR
jgi:hypothetical protein